MDCKTNRLINLEPEVVIIDDEDDNISSEPCKTSRSNQKPKKRHHKKSNRKVKVKKNENKETTLVVTQQVKIKEQKIQCIINLTNICEHKKKNKSLKESPRMLERIVPNCFRNRCQAAISSKCCKTRDIKARTKDRVRSKQLERAGHKMRSKHCPKVKKPVLENKEAYFSPISTSSLSFTPPLTFEDISSDSFTVSSDENLDTLIKRTKDRERRLNKSFEYKYPLRPETLKNVENTSETETIHLKSEGDMSLHSIATLILEPETEIYSPTYPTMSPENTIQSIKKPLDNFEFVTCQTLTRGKYSPIIKNEVTNEEFYNIDKKTEQNSEKFTFAEIMKYSYFCTANMNSKQKLNEIKMEVEPELLRTNQDNHLSNEISFLGKEFSQSPTIKMENFFSPYHINYNNMENVIRLKSQQYSATDDFTVHSPKSILSIKVENSINPDYDEDFKDIKIKSEV